MIELELYQYVIAILGGFLAGAINTMAGNGSAITLSILTEVMGLPGNMANGTNRVGIAFQGGAASYSFFKNGKIPFKRSRLLMAMTIVGAMGGVYVATRVTNEQFLSVFKYLMILMLIIILVKPSRWLHETDLTVNLSPFLTVPLFLCLGFYGGFIQMGMGIFFMAVMVLIAKYNLVEANGVKNLVVGIYTFIVLMIFHMKGLVNWQIGGIIAIGQTTGGYMAAQFLSKYKGAEVWAYRLLVLVVILATLSLFNIL